MNFEKIKMYIGFKKTIKVNKKVFFFKVSKNSFYLYVFQGENIHILGRAKI